MAPPTSLGWHLFKIQLGQGDGPPETFDQPCALTSKGIQFSGNMSEVFIPDCATPESANWAARTTTGQSATISGDGTLDMADLSAWWEWFNGASGKNTRVQLDIAGASGGGYWEGSFKVSSLNFTGARDDNGGYAAIQVELMSDGPVTWVDAT